MSKPCSRKWASKTNAARANAENWAATKTTLSPGKAGRLALGQVGRIVLLKVMQQNGIDLFVHPENTVPTPKILGPNVGSISLEGITPLLGVPRVVVPAGYNRIVYEPRFALNAERSDYISVLPKGTQASQTASPDADRDDVLRRTRRGAGAAQGGFRL